MRKVVVEIGPKGQGVMEISEDSYRQGVFYIPLAKNIGVQDWAENSETSSEPIIIRLVFRRDGDDTFRLDGWED
jgi:hypothetical protein